MNDIETIDGVRRRRMLALAASFALASCGGGGGDSPASSPSTTPSPSPTPAPTPTPAPSPTPTPTPAPTPTPTPSPAPTPNPTPPPAPTPAAKSAKRGVAYDLAAQADLQALAPGVSWWYNWGARPASGLGSSAASQSGMDYLPMLWNANFDATSVENYIKTNGIKYLLVLNEPNLTDQANLTPTQAAAAWPAYEAVAAATGAKIVGPAITWGTMATYADPVVWMDAFILAYQSANGGRSPKFDYLAFHWYDYGLADQLDRLIKYGKPFWVTEMANWHNGDGSAAIDSLAKQEAQMTDMVKTCEGRADVFRYAWFTGRMGSGGDPHFTSLFAAGSGQLTDLGKLYLTLPF